MESRRCLIILSSTARMWLSFSVMRSSTPRCFLGAHRGFHVLFDALPQTLRRAIHSGVVSDGSIQADARDAVALHLLEVTFHCGGGLALAHGGGLFIKLATASLGQHPGFFASTLEATQGDFKRLVFTQFHRRHTDFTSVFGTNKNSRDG